MSDKMLSVMSEMVSKVCEQSKEITQLKAALAKKQAEVEALHDVWWQAYNCFPESWLDVQNHLIDTKGTIDIEDANAVAKALQKKPELFEELPVGEKVAIKVELRQAKNALVAAKNDAVWWEAYAAKYRTALSCELSEKLIEEVKQEMHDKGVPSISSVPAAPPASSS